MNAAEYHAKAQALADERAALKSKPGWWKARRAEARRVNDELAAADAELGPSRLDRLDGLTGDPAPVPGSLAWTVAKVQEVELAEATERLQAMVDE